MATHSIVLAWEMPWTEEPGGLQSKSHKESDMAEHAHTCTHTHIHTHSMWNSACPTVAIRWCRPSLLPPTVQVCTFQGHVCTVITRHPAPGILESLLSEGMKDTCTPTWNWPGSQASCRHWASGSSDDTGLHVSLPEARTGIHWREGRSSCSRRRSGRSVWFSITGGPRWLSNLEVLLAPWRLLPRHGRVSWPPSAHWDWEASPCR